MLFRQCELVERYKRLLFYNNKMLTEVSAIDNN